MPGQVARLRRQLLDQPTSLNEGLTKSNGANMYRRGGGLITQEKNKTNSRPNKADVVKQGHNRYKF